MHEIAMAQEIVHRVLAEVERRGASGVRSIALEVGELEGLQPSSLEEAFRLAAEGTPLERSSLHIAFARPTAVCPRCQAAKPFEVPHDASRSHLVPSIACERCGAAMELRGGRGFIVREATMILPDV